MVVVLTSDDREVRVPAFGSVLTRLIGSLDIRPGDLFAIRYLGETAGKSGTSYKNYRVVLRNPDGSVKDARTEARHEPPPAEFTFVDDPDEEEPF
jgi:hypothetical protein